MRLPLLGHGFVSVATIYTRCVQRCMMIPAARLAAEQRRRASLEINWVCTYLILSSLGRTSYLTVSTICLPSPSNRMPPVSESHHLGLDRKGTIQCKRPITSSRRNGLCEGDFCPPSLDRSSRKKQKPVDCIPCPVSSQILHLARFCGSCDLQVSLSWSLGVRYALFHFTLW